MTTGKPMALASRPASAAEWARPSPARGTPKASSSRREASAPSGPPAGPGLGQRGGGVGRQLRRHLLAGPEGRRRLLVAGEVAQGAEAVAKRPEHGDAGVDEGAESLLVGLERVPGDDDGLGHLVGEGHDVLGETVGEPAQRPGEPDDDDVDLGVGGDEVEDPPAVLDGIGDEELGPVVDRVVDGEVVGDHLAQRCRGSSALRMGTGTPLASATSAIRVPDPPEME